MIVTTYTCDKCGAAKDNADNMWKIGIVVESPDYRTARQDVRNEQLWCRSCVVSKLGTLAPTKDTPPQPDPLPTLEDMIREIVREEIGESA